MLVVFFNICYLREGIDVFFGMLWVMEMLGGFVY